MGAGDGSSYTPAPARTAGASSSASGSNAWYFYLAAAACVLIGYSQLKEYRKGVTARASWTATSGVVTSHRVRRSGHRSPHTYNTYISYSYDMNGAWYEAPPIEVNRNKFYLSEDSAEGDLAEQFPRGGAITVYYDPHNPGDSSLGGAGAPNLGAPVVFFLLAFGAFWFGRQQNL